MSETVNALGMESRMTLVQALAPQAIADATPVLSPAIDLAAYPGSILAVLQATVQAHGVTLAVLGGQEADGPYDWPHWTSGNLSTLSVDGHRLIAIGRRVGVRFLKLMVTGDSADTDALVSAVLMFVR